MTKKIVMMAAGVLLAAATAASAATQTFSAYATTDFNAPSIGDLQFDGSGNTWLALSKFDSSLGTLTGAQVKAQVTLHFDYSVTNPSTAGTRTLTVAKNFDLNIYGPGDTLSPLGPSRSSVVDTTSSNFVMPQGTTQADSMNVSGALYDHSAGAGELSYFVQAGGINEMLFPIIDFSSLDLTFGANVAGLSNIYWTANVSVLYSYTSATTPLPSAALSGGTLMAAGVLRRRRSTVKI